MKTRIFWCFCFILLVCGFGCAGKNSSRVRLGIDPHWYPLDFGAQAPYVNGFVEELLVDIAAYNGIEFECVEANWDSLFSGMEEKKYDAVLTSLSPYNFNLARYDFSENFLKLGSVLLVAADSSRLNLDQMHGELVGLLVGDPAILQVSKHPSVLVRSYETIPDLLEALAHQEIEGAILDRMEAIAYMRDLYAGKFMIAGPSLIDAGLHLVTLKGKHRNLVKTFNKSLQFFTKRKKLEALQAKWQLSLSEYGKRRARSILESLC